MKITTKLPLWAIGLAAAALILMLATPDSVARGEESLGGFNFDDVDIRTFTKLIAKQTGRKFVVANDVQGKVTVVWPGIPESQVYNAFVSVLEAAGCSVIVDGEVSRVVRLSQGGLTLGPVLGPDVAIPDTGMATKVFRLQHIRAQAFRHLLEAQQIKSRVSVGVLEDTNQLVVTDTAPAIRRIARLLQEVDKPGLTRVTEVVPLKFAGADALASQLNAALSETQSRAKRVLKRLPAGQGEIGMTAAPVVVPSSHSNRLMLVGTQSQVDRLIHLIGKMDVDAPRGRGRLNAIFLRYLDATETAESITALLEKSGSDKGADGSRRVSIEAAVSSNALLVDAPPGDFDVVSRLVDQLDIEPLQVHINVMIAEVNDGSSFNWDVQFGAFDQPDHPGDNVVLGASRLSGDAASGVLSGIADGVFPSGLSVGVAQGTYYDADGVLQVGYPGLFTLEAIKGRSDFEVLSETSLEALNNHEAKLSIVDDIPILTSVVQGSGDARDVIQTIERMDVGVKLALTPQIIPEGRVKMELKPSIEAVMSEGEDGLTPTIARREVETTVSVRDGQTIVIAGLTRKDKIIEESRVPILGDIPFLGWLFRSRTESERRTNVLVYVTPKVVSSDEDVAAVSEAWSRRTGLEIVDDGQLSIEEENK